MGPAIASLGLVLYAAMPQLSPMPQEVERAEKDTFTIAPRTLIVVRDAVSDRELAELEPLRAFIGIDLRMVRASSAGVTNDAIYIGTHGEHAALDKRKFRHVDIRGDELPPGAYRISIDRKQAVVAGQDRAGTFYGIQTLLQWIADTPLAWPGVEISDWPDAARRGVVAKGLLATEQIRALAARKCNVILFDSPDFAHLTGITADAWSRVFDDARRHYIDPIPTLRILDEAGALLANAPDAVEGRTQTDAITLNGDDWSALTQRNVVATSAAPVEVAISRVAAQLRRDYLLQEQPLSYPYAPTSPRWLIRRVPGGRIPDGATVRVTYAYAPPGSDAVCPHAPAAKDAVAGALTNIIERLQPDVLYLGGEHVARLHADARCRGAAMDRADAYRDALDLVVTQGREIDRQLRYLLDDAAISPRRAAARYGLPDLTADLPTGVYRIGEEPEFAHAVRAAGTMDAALTALQNATLPMPQGAFIERTDPDAVAVRVWLDGLWSRAGVGAWPQFLNGFFSASLWKPTIDEEREAIVAYLNRLTLRGIDPRRGVDALSERWREQSITSDSAEATVARVARMLELLVVYLEYEQRYTRERDTDVLGRLAGLVEALAEVDPRLTPERTARITDTIRQQRLFVPASILLDATLHYFRPLTAGVSRLYPLPLDAEYTDGPDEKRAVVDLRVPVAPVARVDYETLGADRLVLESRAPDGWKAAAAWTEADRFQLRGPIVLDEPVSASAIRLTAGGDERTVLREVRAYAAKPAPNAIARQARRTPLLSEAVDTGPWLEADLYGGFLNRDTPAFAAAQTAFRTAVTRDALWFAVTCVEPRMHAMAETALQPDEDPARSEAIEIWLQPDGELPTRLAVTAQGVQYDERAGDVGWDAAWFAQCNAQSDRWTAVVRIPLDLFERAPRRGDQWKFNLIRHRRNIDAVDSAWAWDYDNPAEIQWGALRFD